MSEDGPSKPAHDPAASGAPAPNLNDQIDQLLSDVEALTGEVLSCEAPAARSDAGSGSPSADDAGLAAESPLIQDGERIPVDDVVAEVDLALEKVDRMVKQIGGTAQTAGAPEAAARLDDLDVLAQELRECETRVSAAGASGAADAPAPPRAARGDAAGGDAARTVHGLGASGAEIDAASEIPEEPEPADFHPSRTERQLDEDLESLRSARRAEDAQPEPAAPRAPGQQPSERAGATAPSKWSVWRIMDSRLWQRMSAFNAVVLGRLRDGIARLLELMDRPFGRLSPITKNLIGYCALGTLAMCGVALAVLWLL